jgi:hypothetical protein
MNIFTKSQHNRAIMLQIYNNLLISKLLQQKLSHSLNICGRFFPSWPSNASRLRASTVSRFNIFYLFKTLPERKIVLIDLLHLPVNDILGYAPKSLSISNKSLLFLLSSDVHKFDRLKIVSNMNCFILSTNLVNLLCKLSSKSASFWWHRLTQYVG